MIDIKDNTHGLFVESKKKEMSIQKEDREEKPNLFSMIARLVDQLNQNLTEPRNLGELPRWVRMARANENITSVEWDGDKNEVILKGKMLAPKIADAVGYLILVVSELQHYTFKGEELLKSGDSILATAEVALGLLRDVASDDFMQPLNEMLGRDPNDNPLSSIRGGLDTVEKGLSYVPRPEDIKVIKEALYKLLVIKLDSNGAIQPEVSGKIRLLQYALYQKFKVYSYGEEEKTYNAIFACNGKDQKISYKNGNEEINVINLKGADAIYATRYSAEIDDLLRNLNYEGKNQGEKLKKFKIVNAIASDVASVNATLDEVTLNRLYNLDAEFKTIRKAKPYSLADYKAANQWIEQKKAVTTDLSSMKKEINEPSDSAFLKVVNELNYFVLVRRIANYYDIVAIASQENVQNNDKTRFYEDKTNLIKDTVNKEIGIEINGELKKHFCENTDKLSLDDLSSIVIFSPFNMAYYLTNQNETEGKLKEDLNKFTAAIKNKYHILAQQERWDTISTTTGVTQADLPVFPAEE